MSINSASSNNEGQQTQAAPAAAQQQRNAAVAPAMSFHSGGLFAAPISRSLGSEVYSKLKNALVETYKKADEAFQIALIDLDNVSEPDLVYSSLIVAVQLKTDTSRVAYHILTLASSGDKLNPIYENIGGQQIEILRVTSDAIDGVALKKAEERVRRHFGRATPLFCDATVIPADFDMDNNHAVHQLALYTGLACTTYLEVSGKGFEDLNLARVSKESSLNINIGFNRTQVADIVGNPMRSDIQVTFSSKRNSGGGKYDSPNSGEKETRVYEASAFADMVWAPVAPMSTNPWAPVTMNQPQLTQKYVSRLVITDVRSDKSYTPASVLLAIIATQTVRDDNNWIQAFRPTMTQDGDIDLTDIGALNYEANLEKDASGTGGYIDTKDNSFKLQDLGNLIATLVQPGMIVSLDCPDFGPQAWYTSVYAAASRGSQAAYDEIYKAADELTNGQFSKSFPHGSAMFTDLDNRVHLGTWTDKKGNKQDIRKIDHVAVCNISGQRSVQTIRDFSDTWLKTQYPLLQRLAARKRIISALTGETAEFTGFATRVTFTRPFLDAVIAGVQSSGLPVRVTTPLSGSDFNSERAAANFASAALMAPGQSFAYSGGFANGPQFGNGFGVGGNYRY